MRQILSMVLYDLIQVAWLVNLDGHKASLYHLLHEEFHEHEARYNSVSAPLSHFLASRIGGHAIRKRPNLCWYEYRTY